MHVIAAWTAWGEPIIRVVFGIGVIFAGAGCALIAHAARQRLQIRRRQRRARGEQLPIARDLGGTE